MSEYRGAFPSRVSLVVTIAIVKSIAREHGVCIRRKTNL